jgi:hypothetical protein
MEYKFYLYWEVIYFYQFHYKMKIFQKCHGGNGATLGRLVKTKIMLPIDRNHKPDYEYMEQYIENLKYKKIQQYLSYSKSL